MLAFLCHLPFSQYSQPALAHPDLHSALVTPLYFMQAKPIDNHAPQIADSKPAPAAGHNASKLTEPAPDAKPKAKMAKVDAVPPKPVQADSPALEAESKAAEPEATPSDPTADAATTADAADPNANGDAIAPFPGWQMHSNSDGHSFMHHELKAALPVFTPDPPILHGQCPDQARGKDVVMNVIINANGSIAAVEVLQGVGHGVEQAIVQTLREWIYVPAKFNGMAIASKQQIRFHFPG